MCLEVEPPPRFRLAPAVHREREQVRAVLEIAEDRDALRSASPARRVDAQQAVRRARRSETSTATTDPIDDAVNGPCESDEPAKRKKRSSLGLLHAFFQVRFCPI